MKTKDIVANLKKLVTNNRTQPIDVVIQTLKNVLITYRLDSWSIGENIYDKSNNTLAIITISLLNGSESASVIFFDPICRKIVADKDATYKYEAKFTDWSEKYLAKTQPKRRKRIKRK